MHPGQSGRGLLQSKTFVCLHKSPGCTSTRFLRCEPISSIGNGRVAPDLALLQGARRENILHGSLTDEQRSSSAKAGQPGGLISGGHLAALLLSHRALWPCSFVAPCQVLADCQTRQKSARPFLIYEVGSSSPLKNYGYRRFIKNRAPTRRDEGENPSWIFD